MIVIEDLFKCSLMLLWNSQKAHLKKIMMISKKKKGYEFDTDLTAEDLKR